jgi:NADPH-dependent glutamate synthase beta subunit-like oxidoreductase
VNGFENVDKERLIEWLRSDLFEPVLQHLTDAADMVTSNTMKQSGSKEQENKEEEINEHDSHVVEFHYVDTLLKCW